MNDIERLIRIIEEGKKKKIEEINALLEEEFKEKMKNLEENYEKEKEKLQAEYSEEKRRLEEYRTSMHKSVYSKERALLKSKMVEVLKEKIKEILKNAPIEKRRLYLEFLYTEAVREMDDDYYVLCRKEDVELVKGFCDKPIEPSDEVDGGLIIVSTDGRLRIIATLDVFLEKLEGLMNEIAERRAGDLR